MKDNFKSGFVTLIGRPNAGKSTLLNSILGQKIAIMSSKPQTTRNRIQGFFSNDSAQIVFIDTPGIHKPKDKLGDFMVNMATSTFNEVDIVLYLVDATSQYGAGEAFIIEELKKVKTPVFLILNKIDKLEKEEILPLIDLYRRKYDFAEIIPLSALKKENIQTLLDALLVKLPAGPQYYPEDMVTDQPERAIVAELIREKVLHKTKDEIPHAVAVEIEQMKQRHDDLVYISAIIYVERDSQKGIIIGKAGQMLKDIGAKARRDIERLLGSKIYLELHVKVKKDWRNKEVMLRNFGYDSQNYE